jgi:hypothetical protein
MDRQTMKMGAVLVAMLGLAGCGDSPEVAMVKGGSLGSCPSHTVEQMVDGFFGSPSWESGTTDGGQSFVNVSGDMTMLDKEVRTTLQFMVDAGKGTFEFNAIETNGAPQPQLIALAVLSKMCDEATS